MGAIELKSKIHEIVDSIQNEQLLQTIYDFLKSGDTNETGKLWDSLTDEQREVLLLSYEESENEANLIPMGEIYKES